MTQITWTNCADQMPPDGMDVIMRDIDGCLLIKAVSPRLPKELADKLQWIPYTQDAWEELHK